ncbi:unnamed protein product [Closterium sp. NIES-53]
MRLHWKVTTGSLLQLAVTATGAPFPRSPCALSPHSPSPQHEAPLESGDRIAAGAHSNRLIQRRGPPPISPPPRFPPSLSPPSMKLHWKVATGSLLELAVTATGAAATGWFGVAFSKSGGMVTSDAVIANQGGSPVPVNTYAVTSYSTVKATTAFGAGSRSFTGGTTATMK